MSKKTKGVIAAGHEKTVEAGKLIFDEGGNAFDAALASLLAACVVEGTLTSLGGGGFFLAHQSNNQNILFDFFSQTPQQKKLLTEIDFYPVEINFGDASQVFHIGLGSMAVPGNVAGIFQVHEKLGKLPLKIIGQPAIEYAKKGFTINQFQDFCFRLLESIFLASPEGVKIYAAQGHIPQEKEVLCLPELADSLDFLLTEGVQEFYQGEFAHKLVTACAENGGFLQKKDLLDYQVILRQPLISNYRGFDFISNPPPSSGGILINFSLKLLAKFNLSELRFGEEEHLLILAELMKKTNEVRKLNYDSFIHDPDIEKEFLKEEHMVIYQQQISNNLVNKMGSTTHISVMDEEGNAASITTSNGEGSSFLIPETGIMVNNMLGEADLNPHGFHQWQCNQRLSSMMAPSLILEKNRPKFVIGSGGSNRIRTAILQVISNLIDFQMTIEQAVESPRVHWEDNVFNVEPPLLRNLNGGELPWQNWQQLVLWNQKNMFFGGVHGVSQTNAGFCGVGDSRREGKSSKN
jgi:gamma-glutamyltranspeptidase/glutathione hydrolase